MESSQEESACVPPPHERIRLHFFDAEGEQSLRTKWDRLAIRAEKPPIAEIPDGLIPQLSRAFMAGSRELDCVFDQDNRPVPTSRRFRGVGESTDRISHETINFEGADRDDRTAYLLGANARHYGHFLLEAFSRAWAWDRNRHQVAIILSPPILEFARSLCAFLPGLAERMEVIERTTRFRHVTVPSSTFSISRESYFELKLMCERIAENAVPRPDDVTEQPVYLSRARLQLDSNRALIGETRLEQLLESEGFRIVHPETLPIAEQIAIVNRHKWIVAPMGSACHTRLFSRIDNNLLMLTSDHVHRNYVLCDLLSRGATHYANVFSSPIRGDRIPLSLKPVMLDDDRLLRVLKEFGLVRSDARFSRPSAELDAEMERYIGNARRRAGHREKKKAKRSKRGDI
jgi:hypothetical protein